MMMAASTLIEVGSVSRELFLYDTYKGMPEPTEHDIGPGGVDAMDRWKGDEREGHNDWCYASLGDVEKNLKSIGYPESGVRFIEGKVENTIPDVIPEDIAILRLDTDWYSSTVHELRHLFPKLKSGGLLILDDYGFWDGQRKAVDEYFESDKCFLLNRIDDAGRIYIKR